MNTKCEFKWFNIVQYNEEAEYLRMMHQQGWKLERVGFPGFYHFVQCQPEDVIYQLDYNQDGVAHKSEYVQMFADCGWEYLFDFVGYSYFRKPAAEAVSDEGIFCDDASRIQMLERVMKGRLLPLLVLFLTILLPQFFLLFRDLGSPFRRGLFVFYAAMIVVYLIIFVYTACCYLSMKNKKG